MGRIDWNLPPPPGFHGLHPDKPVTMYFRHLPHWRQDGATYFVTFRLNDSLPQSKLSELRALKASWERRHPPPRSRQQWEVLSRETIRRVEHWLDQGMGSCRLRDGRSAQIVANSRQYFDEQRYELDCYVMMPNHVHVLVRPAMPARYPLEKILQSWKRHASQELNSLDQTQGSVWQEESFDRIVRDEEHLDRCIQYIGRNPAKARLQQHEYLLWIRPEWQALGWTFRSVTE